MDTTAVGRNSNRFHLSSDTFGPVEELLFGGRFKEPNASGPLVPHDTDSQGLLDCTMSGCSCWMVLAIGSKTVHIPSMYQQSPCGRLLETGTPAGSVS